MSPISERKTWTWETSARASSMSRLKRVLLTKVGTTPRSSSSGLRWRRAAAMTRMTSFSPRRAKAQPQNPSHHEISERAYFISLQDPTSDQLGNWLRAERELRAA